MSLVQVQRSPSPSIGDETESLVRYRFFYIYLESDSVLIQLISKDFDDSRCSSRNRSISECYFAVRGAAVVLPHSDNSPTCSHGSAQGAEIESHLQLMLRLLRPQDTMNMAVRLQTQNWSCITI
uniref:Uncharacterized protein n=1 Tax=Heterorhabditis bacteriophora TaxID=37862 RepID=A0A1I7XAW5_HETBA